MKPTEVDVALQGHTPVVMVPFYGEFEPLQVGGHRFLAARNGLWLEVRRPWLHLVWPLATQASVQMPFGKLEQRVELAFGRIPEHPLLEFMADAAAVSPYEVGGVVVWDERTGGLHYRKRHTVDAGVGYLRALWPTLDEGEHVVIDIHSHGSLPAFFSDTDRRDTGTEVVIAGVVGDASSATPQWVMSIFACGLEIPIKLPDSLRNPDVTATARDLSVDVDEPLTAEQ